MCARRVEDAHALLRDVVATYCEVGPDSVRIGSRCPHCGSQEHGRPLAWIGTGRPAPHVSLARAGSLLVVAVTDAGPVGVDVEPAQAASFPGFDQVALHPAEHVTDDAGRTRTWVRKEALLKATGDGLRVDPRTVRLTGPQEPPGVLDWPALREPAWLYDLQPAPGHSGAVAVLSPTAPRLHLHLAP